MSLPNQTANYQVMGLGSARVFKGELLKGAENYATWAFTFTAYLQGRDAEALIADPKSVKNRHA